MSEYQYGQFSEEHLEAIRSGIELFNVQKYWECHEELEDHWLSDVADNARFVYWAVIQVATALYHYREDNLPGARGMIRKSLDKLERCEKMKVETPLLYENLSWKEFKKMVRSIPRDCRLEDFKELYSFKFQEPAKWKII